MPNSKADKDYRTKANSVLTVFVLPTLKKTTIIPPEGSEKKGLNVNCKKMECMAKQVEVFKYLGRVLTKDWEVRHCNAKAY